MEDQCFRQVESPLSEPEEIKNYSIIFRRKGEEMDRCKKFIILGSVLPTLIVLMVNINKLTYHYDWNDSFWRCIFAPMTGTVWAKNFSEVLFDKVHNGMNKNDVENLLGQPLSSGCIEGECFWSYSRQETPTDHFDRRRIVFNSNWRVIGVEKYFYID